MLLRIGPGRMDDLLMPSMESVKGSQCRCRGRQHRLIQFIQCCYGFAWYAITPECR